MDCLFQFRAMKIAGLYTVIYMSQNAAVFHPRRYHIINRLEFGMHSEERQDIGVHQVRPDSNLSLQSLKMIIMRILVQHG